MKIRLIPKSLGDCVACIIDLANENEELKNRVTRLENINTARAIAAAEWLKQIEPLQNKLLNNPPTNDN